MSLAGALGFETTLQLKSLDAASGNNFEGEVRGGQGESLTLRNEIGDFDTAL